MIQRARNRDLGEPAATQEWISETFGRARSPRAPDRKDLQRMTGPDAARFRRENPDAGAEDFKRYLQQKGRWQE